MFDDSAMVGGDAATLCEPTSGGKREKEVVRVYQYGLLPPTENAEMVREIMFAAHRHRNDDLLVVECGRRAAVRAIRSDADHALATLEAAVAQANDAVASAELSVRSRRASTRSRSETRAAKDRLTAARAQRAQAKRALREYRAPGALVREIAHKHKKAHGAPPSESLLLELVLASAASAEKALDDTRARREVEAYAREVEVNGMANELVNNSYAHSKLKGFEAWGTRALVSDAMAAARKDTPLYDETGIGANDPRFKRWSGDGHVGIQIHQKGASKHGMTADEIHACAGPSAAWIQVPRPSFAGASRRAGRRTTLRMRVGSDAGQPVFATWPMIMHRPLPEGWVVRRVAASVKRVGPREQWTCEFTVAAPGRVAMVGQERAPGLVAVDFGPLDIGTGLRVARWLSDTGEAGEIVLTHDAAIAKQQPRSFGENGDKRNIRRGGGVLSGLSKAEELRSIRDKNMGAARDALVEWLRERGVPEWMRALTVRRRDRAPSEAQALAYLSGWRSPKRMSRLALLWRSRRYDGDVAAFESLEAWRYRDRHHWAWERAQWLKSKRRQREEYRRCAHGLAKRFGTVIVDDTDLSRKMRKPRVEAEAMNPHGRSNRQRAAVGTLRSALRFAVEKRVGEVVEVSAAGLGTTCPRCGACGNTFDDGHTYECPRCGYKSDLDETRLMNMLRVADRGDAVDAMMLRRREVVESIRRVGHGAPSDEGDGGDTEA